MRRTLPVFAVLVASLAIVAPARADVKGKLKSAAEAAFDKVDKNHDGKITKEEFRALIAELGLGKGKAGFADKLFDQLDTHKHGVLTKAEVKKLLSLKSLPGLAKEELKMLGGKLKDKMVGKIAGKLKSLEDAGKKLFDKIKSIF
jgi:Ca2+-binding EF-hand superfamily protein